MGCHHGGGGDPCRGRSRACSMSNTISAFLEPRKAVLLMLVLAVAAGTTWLLRGRLGSRARTLAFFALAASVGLVLQVTLLRDGLPTAVCLDCMLEWSTERAVSGAIGAEVLLNVALFVPLGFLATLLWRRPFVVTAMAGLLSVAIELLQPVIGVGVQRRDGCRGEHGRGVRGELAGSGPLPWPGRSSHETGRWAGAGEAARGAGGERGGLLGWIDLGGDVAAGDRRARALEDRFAGTALADYERWEADDLLDELVFSKGAPWASDAFRDDLAARVRFPASFYFAEPCVLGTWALDGFSTSLVAGPGPAPRPSSSEPAV